MTRGSGHSYYPLLTDEKNTTLKSQRNSLWPASVVARIQNQAESSSIIPLVLTRKLAGEKAHYSKGPKHGYILTPTEKCRIFRHEGGWGAAASWKMVMRPKTIPLKAEKHGHS